LSLAGIKLAKADASLQVLATNDLSLYNKLTELSKLKPGETKFSVKTNKFNHGLPAYSVSVFRIPFVTK
jgi:alpha-L-arabinofuranosidase